MTDAPKISRRAFIVATAAVGGGLAIGINPFSRAATVRAADGSPEITAWVVIRPDDTVVVRIARSEMGQGSITGLAQLLAEELECDWRKVTWEYPTPGTSLARNKIWGPFGTGGSDSIRGSQEYVRKGGAAARMMLVQAAANAWNVPAAECTVESGVISHKASGRSTTYGKVAEAAAKLDAPKEVPLKDPKDWKIIGKPVKRLDTADKLTGKQVYGADIKLPGMLNASIKACPVFGGKVKSIDAKKVEAMSGVKKVVRVGDSAVAVIADTWWHANTALDALVIEWDEGENAKVSSASIDAMLQEGLGAKKVFVHDNKMGDSKAAIAGAAKRIEAIYDYPFQNHACMEPMNTTALWTRDRCEVWCPTQTGHEAIEAVAAAAGLPIAKCDVYKIHLGGGFGRRGFRDYVTQAVLVAKEMPGTPVKLLWSREEDMAQGRYHPVTKAKLTGGLDAKGDLNGLEIRFSAPSITASTYPTDLQDGKDPEVFQGLFRAGGDTGGDSLEYSIPNLTIDHAMRNTHVPPGYWRGVTVNHNAIFLECFIDELAHAARQDPLAFRRKLMADHPKALAVLEAVADKGGWRAKAAPGRYRGIAQFHTRGSYVAALTEISVQGGDRIKIHRVVLGIDPGVAVNPAQIERQIAGCVVFSLSAMFLQECTVKDGRIEQENFESYDSMRIAQMPKVESIIMPSGGFWGGVGEPPVCVAPPAVLNAYFAATGRRIRSLPLKKHGIRLV
jgi:isoquinoline 1-oxidoreductase beta subunit